MSDKPLNADVRDLQIHLSGHKVTVDALINVAVGLEWDLAFGTEYLNRFEIMETPTADEILAWIKEPLYAEYTEMISPDSVNALIELMPRIQFEVSIAQIRAECEAMGVAAMEIEVPSANC